MLQPLRQLLRRLCSEAHLTCSSAGATAVRLACSLEFAVAAGLLLNGSGAEADAVVGGCTAADRSALRPLMELLLWHNHRQSVAHERCDVVGCPGGGANAYVVVLQNRLTGLGEEGGCGTGGGAQTWPLSGEQPVV